MHRIILVLSLAIFYSTASVDEVVPQENLFALDNDLDEATQKINEMTAAGKSDKDCRKLVTDTRKDITTNVNSCQKIVAALPRGGDCPNSGQFAVKKATELKSKADKHVTHCHTQVIKAASASVAFGSRTFSSLSEGKCSTFYTSSAYTTSEATYKAAVADHTQAKGAADEADKAWKDAIAAAAKAKNECECKTKADQEKAFSTHSAADKANQKDWDFANKVECVLDGNDICPAVAAPRCTRPKLTAAVYTAQCATKKCASVGDICDGKAKCSKGCACPRCRQPPLFPKKDNDTKDPTAQRNCKYKNGWTSSTNGAACFLRGSSGAPHVVDFTKFKHTKYSFIMKMTDKASGKVDDSNIAPHGGFKPCNMDGTSQVRGSSPEFWFIDRAGDYGYGTYNGGFGHSANNKQLSKDALVSPAGNSEHKWVIVMKWENGKYRIDSWTVSGVDMAKGIKGKDSSCRPTQNLVGGSKLWTYSGSDLFQVKDYRVEQYN